MRLIMLILLTFAASAEPPWPLWDGQETVERYAKRVNLSPTQTLDLGNNVKLELVLIPAGQFIMGTPAPVQPAETALVGQTILVLNAAAVLLAFLIVVWRATRRKQRINFSLLFLLAVALAASVAVYGGVRWRKTNAAWREYAAEKARYDADYEWEKPAHPVTLTRPFYMGKFLVTQEQYQQVMGANPSSCKTNKDNPVENVSWDDAQEFCKRLNARIPNPSPAAGGAGKWTVRLPTEAEWENSCRAGTRTLYYSGDTEKDLDRVAWYHGNSKSTIHPVGQKEPNAFGLYDMHGNVYQWRQDWFEEDYYIKSTAEDPQGSAQDGARVLRDGADFIISKTSRSASRTGSPPGNRTDFWSFRVVMTSASKTP